MSKRSNEATEIFDSVFLTSGRDFVRQSRQKSLGWKDGTRSGFGVHCFWNPG